MHLEVLIGPIASGKSSWTKERAMDGALVSNDDSWVTAVHGGNYTLYDPNLKVLYKSFESTVMTVSSALNRDLIIDRTNLTRRMRARYIAMARSIDVPIIGVMFPIATAEEHAKRRMSHDGRGHDLEYWTKVCTRHLSEYEPPSLEEGFDSLVPVGLAFEMRQEGFWSASQIISKE